MNADLDELLSRSDRNTAHQYRDCVFEEWLATRLSNYNKRFGLFLSQLAAHHFSSTFPIECLIAGATGVSAECLEAVANLFFERRPAGQDLFEYCKFMLAAAGHPKSLADQKARLMRKLGEAKGFSDVVCSELKAYSICRGEPDGDLAECLRRLVPKLEMVKTEEQKSMVRAAYAFHSIHVDELSQAIARLRNDDRRCPAYLTFAALEPKMWQLLRSRFDGFSFTNQMFAATSLSYAAHQEFIDVAKEQLESEVSRGWLPWITNEFVKCRIVKGLQNVWAIEPTLVNRLESLAADKKSELGSASAALLLADGYIDQTKSSAIAASAIKCLISWDSHWEAGDPMAVGRLRKRISRANTFSRARGGGH